MTHPGREGFCPWAGAAFGKLPPAGEDMPCIPAPA